MNPISNDTTRVWSNDRKYYLDMPASDVYHNEDAYSDYVKVDESGNGYISRGELETYNGNTVIIGGTKFYPELRLESVPTELKFVFRDLDNLERDGKLSKEEIDAYKNYLNLKDTKNQKSTELENNVCKRNVPLIGSICSGVVGFIGGLIGTHVALKSGYDAAGHPDNHWFYDALYKKVKYPRYATGGKNYYAGEFIGYGINIVAKPLKKVATIAGGLAAAGLLACLAYKLLSNMPFAKKANENVEVLSKEIDQLDAKIRELDEKYKHVNAEIRDEQLRKEQEAQAKEQEQNDDGISTGEALGIGIMVGTLTN